MQWEYRTVKAVAYRCNEAGALAVYAVDGVQYGTVEQLEDGTALSLDMYMAKLGHDRWELISNVSDSWNTTLIFKRPVAPVAQQEIVMQIDGKTFARAVTPSIAHEYQTVLLKSTERGL